MRHVFFISLLLISSLGFGQSVDQSAFQELKYRMIGPFRAGRTVGAVGIPDQPNVFFIGVNNGGVWKTDDFGRTWNPIFDEAPTGSIGDLAVSPSNPGVIYVGTGEGLHRPDLSVGDGMFKSIDGGKSWTKIGLDDIQQIARVIVHPSNPNIVFVAGLGHPYGANEMRGIFRTTNGGQSWEKVLYVNHNTGAVQVEFDPTNPQILFADMWEHQEGPWENAAFSGPNSGLYKSIDGGSTWAKLNNGLPNASDGLGRIGVGISPSNPKRIYATVDARQNGGIYRSDDGGESWKQIATDRRLWGRGSDFAEIKVHPKNPDMVYVANVASYRSYDGGLTWSSFKGAPGGDDYHRIWINPINPDIMIFAADQGAVVTVNAGKTWSSWYNQPTSQLYHVSTDNQFPYWVYGGQQESGAIGIASRGNGGQISFRDFMGVGADEYAYVAPDPKDPNIIYGGRVVKFNKKTGQSQNVAPEALRSGDFRYLRTMPLIFHPADPNMLLFGTNVLWKTMDGGNSWTKISKDLTREQPEPPASIGDFRTESMNSMSQRAIIYSLGPSHIDSNTIWAGTDDGLVHLTNDGGNTWKNVTPPQLEAWDKISQIDAGHFDTNTAYIAVNSIRKDDMRPHIYRTHDGGKTWKEITSGMDNSGPVNTVREDLRQKGLLFAGTEREVYFTIDDGEHWQSLRLNMPASSIRDLVIHENDLVIGTHGRSIWIMDDFSPLRELSKIDSASPVLFEPSMATRVRHNMFSDTPLPPEEPTGKNPYDGTAIDYYLPKVYTEVKMEVLDLNGNVVQSWSSLDKPEFIDSTELRHPVYWMRPQKILGNEKGHNRFIWNLRYPSPKGANREFAIAAIYEDTPSGPEGIFVHPGEYKIKLDVDGQVLEKRLKVRTDPRITISVADLQLQTDLSMDCYNNYLQLEQIRQASDVLLSEAKKKWKKGVKEQLTALRGNGNPNGGDFLYGSISASDLERETIVSLQEKYLFMVSILQSADAKPTEQTQEAIRRLNTRLIQLKEKWESLR